MSNPVGLSDSRTFIITYVSSDSLNRAVHSHQNLVIYDCVIHGSASLHLAASPMRATTPTSSHNIIMRPRRGAPQKYHDPEGNYPKEPAGNIQLLSYDTLCNWICIGYASSLLSFWCMFLLRRLGIQFSLHTKCKETTKALRRRHSERQGLRPTRSLQQALRFYHQGLQPKAIPKVATRSYQRPTADIGRRRR